MKIETSAPAKIILLGEHAVVYGEPAIAVPVPTLRARVRVYLNPNAETGFRIYTGLLSDGLPSEVSEEFIDSAIAETAHLILEQLKHPAPNVTLTLHSEIPMASGMGSGAAVSAALTRALVHVLAQELDDDGLNAIVYETEKTYHGTPSGLDNTVIVYEQPIFFIRDTLPQALTIKGAFTLLIGDTGQQGPTKIAVGDVRKLYEAEPERIQPILTAIGETVLEARQALELGDAVTLGALMTRNHGYLQELTVSSAELDQLVQAALEAGALGAKLSGGGRGGNMIALVHPEDANPIEKALYAAGAVRVTQMTLGETAPL